MKKANFRSSTTANLRVDVNQSYKVPVTLEIGSTTQSVEVQATAAAQLQTTDAQVGDVVNSEELLRLPTLQRNASELLQLQPAVNVSGSSGNPNVRVSGAQDDQNTTTLDGIDITLNSIGGTRRGSQQQGAVVPTPVDSVEEFRVNVANPNVNFDRSSGGN